MTTKLTLLAPLRGWCAPLEEAPDPVFAERLLGDGVAIDPIGATLHAPCDGTVIQLPASRHAVTVRAPNGAEILLHIGIDTVGLGGEGFTAHVRQGQSVRAGDRLLSFDLDLLAQQAKSVLTPVIVTNGDRYQLSQMATGRTVEVGDALFELTEQAALGVRDKKKDEAGRAAVTRRVKVSLEHGIHARPAALLAAAVKKHGAEVTIAAGERKANARSPVALMSLGIRHDDVVAVEATGADADAAAAAVEEILATRGSHTAPAAGAAGVRTATATPGGPGSDDQLPGVVASRGLAVGHAFQLARLHIEVPETADSPAQESAALDTALHAVRAQLASAARSTGTASEVAAAHLELLDDPELDARARELIRSGKSAGFAWRAVLSESSAALRSLEDSRMAERADDLLDIESRVLAALTGNTAAANPVLPQDAILMANDLLPSQLTTLDTTRLAGICLAAGGPTSHVAIIAASMDIPMLVAVGPNVLHIAPGTPVVLDAEAGSLSVDPPQSALAATRKRLADHRTRRAAELALAQTECHTADRVRIEVFTNVGSPAEARLAAMNGAEGCGLLRTEFLFLERTTPPDEATQLDQYQQIARELPGRPITIRTLDIGGDKPIPYLPLPREGNPALGLRGIRTSLWRPDLLRTQLRAILQVRPVGQCRILLPMISEAGEIRAVRRMMDELRSELGHPEEIALGAMIETPAAALLADWIAREADFLSIGTNDLTQYTLAMDRGQADLAGRLDGLHPSVLRLIARTVAAARGRDRMVAVCGGLASDAVAVPILIGLGVTELSVVPAAIPGLKALIGNLRHDACIALATQALECETAESVRALKLPGVLDAAGTIAESP